LGLFIALVVLIVLLIPVSRNLWMPWIGEWLVSSDTPETADLIVVLGGDFWGHRVVEAADLALQGYARLVLISGPDYFSQGVPVPEGDMATQFLLEKGYPRELFETFAHHATTTIEEAKLVAAEIRRRQSKRVLIVTSNYHSQRSRIIFHALLPFSEVRVIGADEDFFDPALWWKSALSRRLTQSEWPKLLGSLVISSVLRLQA
jgi:uncharacterized SAM-binding protein YcdF (DUF218 family)